MISNKKIQLLGVWEENPFGEFSVSEIMKKSGKNTKTWVFNALKEMAGRGILKLRRKGGGNIYLFNISNPISLGFIRYLSIQKNLDFPRFDVIEKLISDIPFKNFCLIVFGSYAEGKQRKNSDVDICFLVQDKKTAGKIVPYVNDVKMDFSVGIDEHYITFDEFKKLLLRKEENLGKQIFRKHAVFFNSDIYYKLITEARENGFRP